MSFGGAGCGKTTLLSILAGSVGSLSRASRVCGAVMLDGQTRRSWASRLIAYVPQFDFLLPTLTVAETLRYSAQLRLPASARRMEVEVRLSGPALLRKCLLWGAKAYHLSACGLIGSQGQAADIDQAC